MRHHTLGYLTLNASPLDTVTAATAAGFQSVGLRIAPRRVNDDRSLYLATNRLQQEVKHNLDSTGCRLASVVGYHIYPDVELEHLEWMVDTAAALGAEYLLTMSYQPDQGAFSDLFAKYCEYADTCNLKVALEFARYSEVKTILQAHEILGVLGLSNARLVVDALHLFRSGGTIQQVMDIASNLIACVQLCDAVASPANMNDDALAMEARCSRLPPGDGQLPLKSLVGALPADLEVEYEVPVAGQDLLTLTERAGLARQRLDEFMAFTVDAEVNSGEF